MASGKLISMKNKEVIQEGLAQLWDQKQIGEKQLSDASIEIKAYTQGLKKFEAQLVAHQKAVPPPMTGNICPLEPDIELDDSQLYIWSRKIKQSESESQTAELDTCGTLTLDRSFIEEYMKSVSDDGVYTAKVKEVSTVGGKWDTAVKSSAGCKWRTPGYNNNILSKYNWWILDNPHRTIKNKEYYDSECSQAHDREQGYLADFQAVMVPCVPLEVVKAILLEVQPKLLVRASSLALLAYTLITSSLWTSFGPTFCQINMKSIESKGLNYVDVIIEQNLKTGDVIEFVVLKGIKREYSNAESKKMELTEGLKQDPY
ncbi:hypothetical protein Tco_0519291 [Tanacetum coccineum]